MKIENLDRNGHLCSYNTRVSNIFSRCSWIKRLNQQRINKTHLNLSTSLSCWNYWESLLWLLSQPVQILKSMMLLILSEDLQVFKKKMLNPNNQFSITTPKVHVSKNSRNYWKGPLVIKSFSKLTTNNYNLRFSIWSIKHSKVLEITQCLLKINWLLKTHWVYGLVASYTKMNCLMISTVSNQMTSYSRDCSIVTRRKSEKNSNFP